MSKVADWKHEIGIRPEVHRATLRWQQGSSVGNTKIVLVMNTTAQCARIFASVQFKCVQMLLCVCVWI